MYVIKYKTNKGIVVVVGIGLLFVCSQNHLNERIKRVNIKPAKFQEQAV